MQKDTYSALEWLEAASLLARQVSGLQSCDPALETLQSRLDHLNADYPAQADVWRQTLGECVAVAEEVLAGLDEDRDTLRRYFGQEEATGAFTADIPVQLRLLGADLRAYPPAQRRRLVLAAAADDLLRTGASGQAPALPEPGEAPAQLMSWLERADLSPKQRWDWMLWYCDDGEQLGAVGRILDKTAALLRARRHRLQPMCDAAQRLWQAEGVERCRQLGVRLDEMPKQVYALAMQPFSTILMKPGPMLAAVLGGEHGFVAYVGAAVHLVQQAKALRRQDVDGAALALKALGDKKRLELLLALKQDPQCGQELADSLKISPATVSHHVNQLLPQGLIALEKQGARLNYSLNREGVQALLARLEELLLG